MLRRWNKYFIENSIINFGGKALLLNKMEVQIENKGSFRYYLWNKVSLVDSFENKITCLNQRLTLRILLFPSDKGFQWSSFTCIYYNIDYERCSRQDVLRIFVQISWI